MPLFPACTTGNTMLIGIDAHSTALPPVPLNPHPFIGVLMLWTSPKFPMSNVMIAGSPACCSGAKGYSVHIPQGTWVDIPKVSFKVWYITNLITVGFVTLFTIAANIMIGVVKGLAASLTDPKVSASKQIWDNVTSVFQPFTQWQTWAQMLIPPIPLPGAEGNCAIGSPTVSVNGGSMALGVPLGGASCSEIPIVPNATVIAFSTVQVGMTFAQLVEAFVTNAITATAAYAGSKAAGRFIERNRCSLGLEPIDLVSGSNFEDKIDFELGGPLLLRWKRYYASTLETDGPLGWNWSHEYQRWLEFLPATVVYHNEQNRAIVFPALEKDGDSDFLPFDRFTLTRLSATQYTVADTNGTTAHFTRLPKSNHAWINRLANRAGEVIAFRYDPKGRLHEIVHSTGQRLKVERQAEGRITALLLAASDGKLRSLVNYEYDTHGDLMAVADAAGQRAKYFYDDKHQMTRKTDRNGYSFHYAYDRNGRCIKSRGDDDLYSGEIEYMPPANVTIMTAPSGGKFIHCYDKKGMITSIMDPFGGVQLFEYDEAGNKVAIVDECGHTTKFKYDTFANIVEETNPFGGTTKRQFNELNLKIEETDPDGNARRWEYDERGNLAAEIEPDGSTTRHIYDDRNRRIETTDPSGSTTLFRYDRAGRLRAKLNAAGSILNEYTYDDMGRLIADNQAGAVQRFSYDHAGHTLETITPDGAKTAREYDAEGNLLELRDPHGRSWRYQYSSWNKRVALRTPGGRVVRYAFSRADELVTVTDGGGRRIQYTRDFNDRISEESRDDIVLRKAIFDRVGNIAELRDGEDHPLVQTEYGPCGVRKLQQITDGASYEFKWDHAGRTVLAEGGGDKIEHKYDQNGLILEINRSAGKITYARDSKGLAKSIKWSEGFEAKFAYSETGAVVEITDPLGDHHRISGAGTRMRSHVCPNGWVNVTEMTPDGGLRLLRLEREDDRSRKLISRYCTVDAAGNRAEEHDRVADLRRRYEHDVEDRLLRVIGDSRVGATYRYDLSANLTIGAENCEFGPGNRLETAKGSSYKYDLRGCPVEIASVNASRKLRYDGAARLRDVKLEDGRSVSFDYDAFGRRTSKEINGKRVAFQYDGHRLLREIGEDWRRLYIYLNDDDAPFMFLDLELKDGTWTATPYYVHSDNLGVARAITDRKGECVWSHDPGAYGEGILDQDHGVQYNLRYPGQYFDTETGWRYNGFRYYNPETGRFLEPDPIGLRGGLNQYAYPANPLRDLDRDGLARNCRAAEAEETRRQIEEETETPHTPVSDLPEFSNMGLGEIRQTLADAGYERLCGPGERTITGRDGRPRTIETSEIWMSREPGPNGEYDAVRIDPGGHQSARDQGFEGGDAHVHRETVPPEFADQYRREFTPQAQTQDDHGQTVPRPADGAPESDVKAWARRTHIYPTG